ncbi:MAG TPA: hypothetical protein VM577_03235 [Anaerovoracaceae bacterium]|nr:hypothetical protein [Anaerovoracaceae bacterium]
MHLKEDIDKSLTSLKAFLPDDQEIEEIIRLCQLYPTISWKYWTDHLGHTLSVLENKKVVILKEHPLSPTEKIITDIYHKALPNRIATNSSHVLIAFGEGDKQAYQAAFVWFLGKDNRLRMSNFSKNEWIENTSPLSSGMKSLRVVSKQIIRGPGIVSGYKDLKGAVPATIVKAWATPLPIDRNVKLDMLLTNNILGAKLIEEFK